MLVHVNPTMRAWYFKSEERNLPVVRLRTHSHLSNHPRTFVNFCRDLLVQIESCPETKLCLLSVTVSKYF